MGSTTETKSVVQVAEQLYRSICEKEGLIDTSASEDVAPGVKLRHLLDSQAWLPFIMIRTDEICQLMTGVKMWNAAYVSDSMALRGLAVVSPESVPEEGKEGVVLPGPDADLIPNGAKNMFALAGLREAIEFRNDQCYLRNLPKAYFIHGPIDEGHALPSVPPELFFATRMNAQTIKVAPELARTMGVDHPSQEVSR